jgi:hypothetical protein
MNDDLQAILADNRSACTAFTTALGGLMRMKSFVTACDEAARAGRTAVEYSAFGTLPLLDYVRLQAIHVRHHLTQVTK